MKDENSPDNPGTPKTGDPLDPKPGGVGIIAALGVLTRIPIIFKNRRKF